MFTQWVERWVKIAVNTRNIVAFNIILWISVEPRVTKSLSSCTSHSFKLNLMMFLETCITSSVLYSFLLGKEKFILH